MFETLQNICGYSPGKMAKEKAVTKINTSAWWDELRELFTLKVWAPSFSFVLTLKPKWYYDRVFVFYTFYKKSEGFWY